MPKSTLNPGLSFSIQATPGFREMDCAAVTDGKINPARITKNTLLNFISLISNFDLITG
jgi:hypothetical protein